MDSTPLHCPPFFSIIMPLLSRPFYPTINLVSLCLGQSTHTARDNSRPPRALVCAILNAIAASPIIVVSFCLGLCGPISGVFVSGDGTHHRARAIPSMRREFPLSLWILSDGRGHSHTALGAPLVLRKLLPPAASPISGPTAAHLQRVFSSRYLV